MEVIAWSLRCLGEGSYPNARHDGTPETLSKAGKQCLVRQRGDWDWYATWYGAPTWNANHGCCWLCSAKPGEWKALTTEERKKKSLSFEGWLQSLEDREKHAAPPFRLPGITNAAMRPDWLRVMDEGCGAMAAGQVFFELMPAYKSKNKDERLDSLWCDVKKSYDAEHVPSDVRSRKFRRNDIKRLLNWKAKLLVLGISANLCWKSLPKTKAWTKAPTIRKLYSMWPGSVGGPMKTWRSSIL